MKKTVFILVILVSLIVLAAFYTTYTHEIKKEECFFLSSLHHTAEGVGFWYDKANGGLETITGVPYSQLVCKDCHVSSCDGCHKKETGDKFSYSTQTAKNQEICLKCHAREASILKIDKAENNLDPHFGRGMQCTDCHTAKEMHGDGVEYYSMKQKGAMEVKCETCHEALSESKSHTVHGDKLDCKACHVPMNKIDFVGEVLGKEIGLQNWFLGMRYKISDVCFFDIAYENEFRETNEKIAFGFHTEFRRSQN